MKPVILESLPAALLIGIETFLAGFGAVWLLFASILPKPFWFWIGIAAGVSAASWTIWALLQNAVRVAEREQAWLIKPDGVESAGTPKK